MFYDYVLSPVICSIKKFPNKNAFFINKHSYTYQEFGNRISSIRTALQQQTPKSKIAGLVINDDLDTYASILALWLEGLCYVPLHPSWPIERCLDIIEQVESDLVLDSSVRSRYENQNILHTYEVNDTKSNLIPKLEIDENDLAYILFTSGSTGKPKGVQLMRKNIGAFMDSFWKTGITIDENDRCLQCFDLTFDVSVQSYLVALTKGACCYTIPYGQIKYIYASSLIEEEKITFGAMAPSMLRYLQPYFVEMDATSLKACILTAEACPLALMEDWFKCAKNTEIYDFYGPTEATIYCTYYKLTREGHNKSLNGIISIGQPMANVAAVILDENGCEVECGEKGELCVAGSQVTKGYWKNPEKNETSFFEMIYKGQTTRFYHTGDLCYQDEDGDIMYSGRLDHQAKIQGFRVEMGEIEFHAREFLGGCNVVCMPFENKDMLTEIAMFIENKEMDTSELVAYMRTKMPAYMIPSKIIFEESFPLNSNDKIDKNKLKSLI